MKHSKYEVICYTLAAFCVTIAVLVLSTVYTMSVLASI